MELQQWIHHWEVGGGAKVLKVTTAILGFVVLAALVDALAYTNQGFANEEAMETAQLARNLSRGKGYTTQTIRPLSIYLLRSQAAPGQAASVLSRPVPDLTTPPAYPVLLAGLMRALPFNFDANEYYFTPERWIAVFNQVLFFLAAVLLFRIAFRLFDSRVAWVTAALFAGSNLYWKFTLSGLSTSWLIVALLAAVLGLVRLQEREEARLGGFASFALAAWAGAWIGIAALSRYGMACMILPVLTYIAWISPIYRGRLCAVACAGFLVVLGPWLARNVAVSGTCFGTASYAILEQTEPYPEDFLERSFDMTNGFQRVKPMEVVNKIIYNAWDMWRNDLPRLGGSWVSAFFLVGLFIPFRNPALGRMRLFLVFSLALLLVVQAAGQTHLTSDSPEINSENLLALLAPLVFLYGVALFYTLFDQLQLVTMDARGAVIGGFILLSSAPLVMSLLVGHRVSPNMPYSPLLTQQVARMMRADEFMVSDVPGAVAWYGDRPCGWLPLDDEEEFYQFNSLKAIKAVYLTQRTTEDRFLSQMMRDPKSWGRFVFDCAARQEVPTGFPLTKAVAGFLPDRMLLSDQARWRMAPVKQ